MKLALVRRWLKYDAVGLMGFGLQLLLLSVLTGVLNVHYLPATLVAVEAAILHNFLWHERWTWNDRPSPDARTRWVRLAKLNFTSGLLSLSGNALMMRWLVDSIALSPVAANGCAVAACALANFLVNHVYVFRNEAPAVARCA
jgi:putative flippase GtrA